MTTDRDRMQALYDAAPYPQVLDGRMEQTRPLLTHGMCCAGALPTM